MNTLDKYTIQHRHLVVESPKTDLENALLSEMCTKAAETIELQCGREYGFGMNENPRATAIYKLTPEERKDLETHNLVVERNLGVFDKRADIAKFRNHKFKAKSIRNDVVLRKSSFKNTPDYHLKQVVKILEKKECLWNENQQKLNQEKILEKLEKAKKQFCYTNKLLMSFQHLNCLG